MKKALTQYLNEKERQYFNSLRGYDYLNANDISNLLSLSNDIAIKLSYIHNMDIRTKDKYLPLVGCFFFIYDELYIHTIKVKPILDNQFSNDDLSHFEFYERIKTKRKNLPFDYALFKRGRIIFDWISFTHIVYVDECILNDTFKKKQIEYVINHYYKIDFRLDDHYKCYNCDKEILDNYLLIESKGLRYNYGK